MYGIAEYELWRRHGEEIQERVAAARLARVARANREERARPAWYTGLLGKRLQSTG